MNETLSYADIDFDRQSRTGYPEVIFSTGKTGRQVAEIATQMLAQGVPRILATKADAGHAAAVKDRFGDSADVEYHEGAHLIVVREKGWEKQSDENHPPPLGCIAVVTAGTSDIPIAEEAALTAEIYGHEVIRIFDVGVAGLHRLLRRLPEIRRADAVIVCAGMDGALASVVGGLVRQPVIAVPTSVGYGASMEGLAALLSMMNSCSLGVCVMNIDNGFGAGHFASMIAGGTQKDTIEEAEKERRK
ncbi:MAG: nickel pincer cofactor biosynthesis protein LarB [Clostridiales Family XIII bacterium]|jgi:NCAIR mutase (PurE)-related protein|nr:nickel pincer cofactor biosynthesis protein LarB [Clostridiales Family XIII bacterium]